MQCIVSIVDITSRVFQKLVCLFMSWITWMTAKPSWNHLCGGFDLGVVMPLDAKLSKLSNQNPDSRPLKA